MTLPRVSHPYHRRPDIFYREAGPKDAPAIPRHGFPTSLYIFRNLIPALADRLAKAGVTHAALDWTRQRVQRLERLGHKVTLEPQEAASRGDNSHPRGPKGQAGIALRRHGP